MKNTTVMTQQTATGPKVLKNWYGGLDPNPLLASKMPTGRNKMD